MNWLMPVGTAAWALYQWTDMRERERRRRQDRNKALYVNPFMSACEDLQSRIYNILELDNLPALQARYPDGSYAEETLYLIVRYFGWQAVVLRYGPHTQDQAVIRLSDAVREAFSTVEYPVGPFAIFRPEQKAMGKLVMDRFEGQYGIEMDTIPAYAFKRKLEEPPLSESHSVRQTLKALREAKDADSLEGKERLADVQRHLVDLLGYMERRERFTLFTGVRSRCESRSPTPRALADPVDVQAAALAGPQTETEGGGE